MKRLVYLLSSLSLLLLSTVSAIPAHAASTNLMANPSVETANTSGQPTNWTPDNWGTNTSSLSYKTNGHTGNKSLYATMSGRTDGDAKWIPDASGVTAGQSYTYTDYYESSVATELDAQYTNASGKVTYNYLTDVAASSSTWKQVSTTFTVPSGITKVSILHILAGNGNLQTDDFSLTAASVVTPPAPTRSVTITSPAVGATVSGTTTVTATATAPAGVANVQFKVDGVNLGTPVTTAPYKQTWNTSSFTNGKHSLTAVVTGNGNKAKTSSAVSVTVNNTAPTGNLISNPSMETVNPANSKAPLDWISSAWGSNSTTFSYLSTGHTGSHSVKTQITNYTNGGAYWYFKNQPLTPGQMYDFSDYYESNVGSEIDAAITMSDGSIQYLYLGQVSPSPNSWTKFDTQFTAPAGAVSVNMEHNIFGVGWLTTDDYSMTTFSYQGFNRTIISITDDDGYASFYNNGLPVLQKYGLKSTDYIISSYVDKVAGYMTSNMVKSLAASGQEIGSHSVDHPDLTTLTPAQQDAELKNSQAFLQNLVGGTIKDYAAPYGTYNQQVLTDAAKYYQTYRSTDAGYNAKNNFTPSNLRVQNVVDTTTLAEVQSWIAEAKSTNTWLVLVYHQVDAKPSSGDYNTYPSDFDAQMSAIKSSGIAVETISQALAEVNSQM